jgi:hypothetical protein
MKCHTVVETNTCQSDEVGAVPWGDIREQFEANCAVIGFEFDRVIVAIEVNVTDGGIDFGFPVLAHDCLEDVREGGVC